MAGSRIDYLRDRLSRAMSHIVAYRLIMLFAIFASAADGSKIGSDRSGFNSVLVL